MTYKLHVAILGGFLALRLLIPEQNAAVLGASSVKPSEQSDTVPKKTAIKTFTAFDVTETTEEEEIPFETKYEEDENMDYGAEEVQTEGKAGTKLFTYRVTKWQDELIDRTLVSTETIPPEDEIITKGTKLTWKMYSTPDVGRIKYWHSLEVFATKYDANCEGCTGRTYSGTEVKKGVCATDPKVIPLGTNFYVEGYGLCRAEDIGGLIKGNRIDLGYVDASTGAWRTGSTKIYLLTNPPQ